jgi:DNA-binding XRE family transcriptional regulator
MNRGFFLQDLDTYSPLTYYLHAMATEYTPTEQKILKRVGTKIRALRSETGLSQEDFAQKVGLDRTYISDVERGERNVSVLNIFKIAKGLKRPASSLLE